MCYKCADWGERRSGPEPRAFAIGFKVVVPAAAMFVAMVIIVVGTVVLFVRGVVATVTIGAGATVPVVVAVAVTGVMAMISMAFSIVFTVVTVASSGLVVFAMRRGGRVGSIVSIVA